MKCHYEVLGIERDADEKTIKNGKIFQLKFKIKMKTKTYIDFIS